MSAFVSLIDRFARDPSESIMDELIKMAKQNEICDEDIAYLALTMAESGSVITFHELGSVADIASTGGPSSLSTLLCPLFLQSFGYIVPKLGVPGRPAGGIDVLAQIPGYQYELDALQIKDIISNSGYAHFLTSNKHAPLDAILFGFRKSHGALNIPALGIASILSKKKAFGVRLVGLDVRVSPYNNFGSTRQSAREHAMQFCRVAKLIGYRAVCFLTDNVAPYQPFIGRGESLLALSLIFQGQAPEWLQNHVDLCFAMARKLTNNDLELSSGPPALKTDIPDLFVKNIEAQGASFESFMEYVTRISKGHTYELLSKKEGFFFVDLGKLREILTSIQSISACDTTPLVDPCGVILKKAPGQYVKKGDLLASVRMNVKLETDLLRLLGDSLMVRQDFHAELFFEEVKDE
ncbi:MAG: hypothetical protein V1882_06635 [Candidatus Omnitrophota bacterium]